MTRILFVCSANKDRSKTADDYFSEQLPELEFLSAGTNRKICHQEGTQLLDQEMLEWADHVFVMEEKHRQWIQSHYRLKPGIKIQVLGIQDIYTYNEKALIDILENKVGSTLRKIIP